DQPANVDYGPPVLRMAMPVCFSVRVPPAAICFPINGQSNAVTCTDVFPRPPGHVTFTVVPEAHHENIVITYPAVTVILGNDRAILYTYEISTKPEARP
ncbi:MAG: hypothetical protein ACR2PL_24980, partial [Dehalococcoidia bacterium]